MQPEIKPDFRLHEFVLVLCPSPCLRARDLKHGNSETSVNPCCLKTESKEIYHHERRIESQWQGFGLSHLP